MDRSFPADDTGALPVVCVANAVDTLRNVARLSGSDVIRHGVEREAFPQQDQALFWRPASTMLISERPVEHLRWQCEFLSLGEVTNLCPQAPAACCLFDAMRHDQELRNTIVERASTAGGFRLVPHTTTACLWTFAAEMRASGLRVELPESCRDQELRDFADSKSGLRALAGELETSPAAPARAVVPPGSTCSNPMEIEDTVAAILAGGEPCIIKPDRGEASVGLKIIRPSEPTDLGQAIRDAPLFHSGEKVVVEQYVESALFPSVEYEVPSSASGAAPRLTHACHMLFEHPTELRGNVTVRRADEEGWLRSLSTTGLDIALELQSRGYQGHFGIDAVCSEDAVYMLDLNARRTGSTHLHDIGERFFGPDYQDVMVVGHYDFYDVPRDLPTVLERLDTHLTSPRDGAEGVFPSELTGLSGGRVSCIVFAPDRARFDELVRWTRDRLQ